MFDLPNWFWNTLAITVFIVINIILWFHRRRCKANGIEPNPSFEKLNKHEKRISKWTDILIAALIFLWAFSCVSTLLVINDDTMSPLTPETVQIKNSVNLLLLFQHSFWVVFMAGLLSFFQKNMTPAKRFTLLVMFCIPLVFGTLYCVLDQSRENRCLQQLIGAFFVLTLFYVPPILLGKPSFEFHLRLLSKIPLPWFQIPEQNEMERQ